MHIILKLLLLRERLFCLLFLFGMTVLAASCQLPEREVSVRRTTTLRAADTVQSPSLKGLIYCYYGRQDLNRGHSEDALHYFSQAAGLFKQKSLTGSYIVTCRRKRL